MRPCIASYVKKGSSRHFYSLRQRSSYRLVLDEDTSLVTVRRDVEAVKKRRFRDSDSPLLLIISEQRYVGLDEVSRADPYFSRNNIQTLIFHFVHVIHYFS